MDRRFLLEGAVRHVRWSGITTAPEILVELQKSVEWGDVTISQVRRINTACNKLEPQLDAEAQAAKRKAAEKARDQKRDRSGRARPAVVSERSSSAWRCSNVISTTWTQWSLPGS